jgi:hypothetical protein
MHHFARAVLTCRRAQRAVAPLAGAGAITGLGAVMPVAGTTGTAGVVGLAGDTTTLGRTPLGSRTTSSAHGAAGSVASVLPVQLRELRLDDAASACATAGPQASRAAIEIRQAAFGKRMARSK